MIVKHNFIPIIPIFIYVNIQNIYKNFSIIIYYFNCKDNCTVDSIRLLPTVIVNF